MNPIIKISISKFRHLRDVEFRIGERLTVISGGNGTGKTSILGLIGHVFTYAKTHKSFLKRHFETQFSEIFRFSESHDKGGEHHYSLEFQDGTIKNASSRETVEAGKKRFRIDVGERKENEGKVLRPAIYLGLKRLIPLAQENESGIKLGTEDNLPDDYKELFNNYYNKIFATDIRITPQHTKSRNKESYSPTSENYDAFGISAGQDNVGQIILALLSFKKLREEVQGYDGGVLIIDELDATLYPAAQKNLLKLLLVETKELNIQVIFTTHSTDILNFIFSKSESHFKRNTEFVFLDNSKGRIEALQGGNILESVVADLNHEVVRASKPKRVNVYVEDSEAKTFLRNLIKSSSINKRINVQDVSLGSGNYINLLKAGFPEFDNSLIVLDGDQKSKDHKKYKKRVIFLPGTTSPEILIKEFLQNLQEEDDFWGNAGGYTKRVFLQNSKDLKDERRNMKHWFNNEKQHWGRGCSKLFKKWKELNQQEVQTFVDDLTMKIDSILN